MLFPLSFLFYVRVSRQKDPAVDAERTRAVYSIIFHFAEIFDVHFRWLKNDSNWIMFQEYEAPEMLNYLGVYCCINLITSANNVESLLFNVRS